MTPPRLTLLALVAASACLPGNPSVDETGGTGTDGTGTEPTGGSGGTGLFACDGPCTLVLVSQTLDDRVDVFDTATGTLRGRIALDLKPDPSGQQIEGNLLDEPYELALTATDLFVTVGHYPDTDQGSLLRFPRAAFADLEAGQTFAVDRYFAGGSFSAGVEALEHARQEGIFVAPHPSGRLLVGVFANDLKTPEDAWTTPSELLVVDPGDFSAGAVGSVDLGGLMIPCLGGWRPVALDADVSRLALACDGSDSVAVLTLPDDLGSAAPQDAAAGVTGCGLNLGQGWVTQFVAPDGEGGLLAVQSQLAEPPRLWRVRGDCTPAGAFSDPPGGDLAALTLLREPVLVRGGGDPVWLIAAGGASASGVVIARGGGTPELCGWLGGLDAIEAPNAPWALALDASGEHLAIGAGPPSQPQSAEGRAQVLWGALDRTGIDDCQLAVTDVVDLNAGLYAAGDPTTWSRAPNVVVIAELGGGG